MDKVKKEYILIKNGTQKGYIKAYLYDGVDLNFMSSNSRRGRVQHKKIMTIDCGAHIGVVVYANK